MGVEPHQLPVARLDTRDTPDEAPMGDDGDALPVRQAASCGTKPVTAPAELGFGFEDLRPPDLLDVIEGQMRPARGQPAARRADIAAEGGPLPNHRLDGDGDGHAHAGGNDLA